MRPKQMTTVGEIRRLLDGYPDDLPVDFSPITAAWLGTMGALRATDQLAVYDRDGESCGPLRPGAYLTMYLYEEEERTQPCMSCEADCVPAEVDERGVCETCVDKGFEPEEDQS